VLGTSLLWRSTVAFTYSKVKSAKCLCLLPVVLVYEEEEEEEEHDKSFTY